MRRETELLFDSLVREDRNVLDLLTANYTFVDERLAKHYGIPEHSGQSLPARDHHRSEPVRTSRPRQHPDADLDLPTRTSPVQRGKYVMEVLLGTPPPPPPPNVPALKEASDNGQQPSVRERMEQHRKNEPCHSCHQLMDPIGFSLENFDAVGSWRTNDSAQPVDADGKMFDGTKLNGPVSLRQAILKHSDVFVGTFTENLLAYGLGRVIDYRDMPFVREIEREAAKNDNHFSSFVMGIVKSVPFQMRRAEESAAGANDCRRPVNLRAG